MADKTHKKTGRIATMTRLLETQRDFAYDSDEGAKALAAIRTRLDAIPPEEVAIVRLDVAAAAYAALAVARFVQSPDVRPRFAELPKRAFDMALANDLASACFAALFSITEAQAEGALDTEAQLVPAIAAEATELEKRMQTVCEYQLWDDAQIAPLLAILKPGTGYRDLLNDLKGYVWIYEKRPDAVKADAKNYRAGDLKRAKEMIGIIGLAFSDAMSPKAWQAYDTYLRCWTLLEKSYDEVRSTGLWLFRKDPSREQRFPSLYAAARPNVGRPRKQTGPAPAPETDTTPGKPAPAPAAQPTGQ
jgi:hypothetical protein